MQKGHNYRTVLPLILRRFVDGVYERKICGERGDGIMKRVIIQRLDPRKTYLKVRKKIHPKFSVVRFQ